MKLWWLKSTLVRIYCQLGGIYCILFLVKPKCRATPLSKAAIREFERLVAKDWGGGVLLDELLDRVNCAVAKLRSSEGTRDSRVSLTFQSRSFRHYQTLGCIDPGERKGRQVVYGCRHFVQALLVRRLLWERVPAEQIAVLMAGRSTEETERMFLGGIEMVAKTGEDGSVPEVPTQRIVETWRRVQVVPGVELHLRHDIAKLRGAALKDLLESLEDC